MASLRPIYEMVWNHYENRRGIKAPYTREAAEKIRPEGEAHSPVSPDLEPSYSRGTLKAPIARIAHRTQLFAAGRLEPLLLSSLYDALRLVELSGKLFVGRWPSACSMNLLASRQADR